MQFLVVDDEPLFCEEVSEALHVRFNAGITCATSAVTATHLLASAHFDFALIDVVLRGVSGAVLAGLAANANVPVLLTSGNVDATADLSDLGYDVMGKPFRLELLYRHTSRLLGDTAASIRRLRASAARMRANVSALEAAVTESGRLIAEARRLTADPTRPG